MYDLIHLQFMIYDLGIMRTKTDAFFKLVNGSHFYWEDELSTSN